MYFYTPIDVFCLIVGWIKMAYSSVEVIYFVYVV